MITRIVRMQLHQGKARDFMTVFKNVNNQIKQSKGCISVELYNDSADFDTVITLSRWESADALEAYRASALFISTWKTVKPFFRAPALAFSMSEAG